MAQDVKIDVIFLYPYRPFSKCKKCGFNHLLINPKSEYDPEKNVLIRTCRECGFEWFEQCADGSHPTITWVGREE